MNVDNVTYSAQLKPAVIVTGIAKERRAGPPVDLVHVVISDDAYLFRAALPDFRSNICNLKCAIECDGKVHIEGMITGGEILKDSSIVCRMKIRRLHPPGPFSMSFNLPGPVDPRLSSPKLRPDGILEVVVMKNRQPDAAVVG